jgi:excisionase family DNA binding protein
MCEKFITLEEAAEYLSVTPRRIAEMARAGEIPCHPLRDGQRITWRFLKSELYEYLKQRTRQPSQFTSAKKPRKSVRRQPSEEKTEK